LSFVFGEFISHVVLHKVIDTIGIGGLTIGLPLALISVFGFMYILIAPNWSGRKRWFAVFMVYTMIILIGIAFG